MTQRLILLGLVVSYLFIIIPFTDYLKQRPMEVKLGYLPHPQIVNLISGEHRSTYAACVVMKILFYYGTIIQKYQERLIVPPEFHNMYKTLEGAAKIDPYNMDVYYFTQAAFTWELGRIHEVNSLLERGMNYRTWDYWLPFYLGFNYSFFLKDYNKAALYLQRAAEISGNSLFTKLASRYFFESDQADLGLAFLNSMIQQAKSTAVRKSYEMRRDALLAVLQIQKALLGYRKINGHGPSQLSDLVNQGLMERIPTDPYGGLFYLDVQGRVRSSSHFIAPPVQANE